VAVSMNGSKASGAKGKGGSLSSATADAEAPCEQIGFMKGQSQAQLPSLVLSKTSQLTLLLDVREATFSETLLPMPSARASLPVGGPCRSQQRRPLEASSSNPVVLHSGALYHQVVQPSTRVPWAKSAERTVAMHTDYCCAYQPYNSCHSCCSQHA